MPLTVKELLDNPERKSELYPEPEKCAGCGKPLSGFITGRNPNPKGTVCDDCHYSELGDEIEEHPLGPAK
jgi:hypothetical protein